MPFAVKIVSELLSDRINFASYFCQFPFLRSNLFEVHFHKNHRGLESVSCGQSLKRASDPKQCRDYADSKGFQFPKRHYFFGATVFELMCHSLIVCFAKYEISAKPWASVFGLDDYFVGVEGSGQLKEVFVAVYLWADVGDEGNVDFFEQINDFHFVIEPILDLCCRSP